MKIPNVKVFARCITYNQADYIKDAMDGFCIQKTSFPYLCAIVDDASTDGEQDIILKYFRENFDLLNSVFASSEESEDYHLFCARHRTNKNCFFVVILLKYNHYQIKKSKSQYLSSWSSVADFQTSCEGDDYWIDPDKLQKQVDFLENHPDCSATFGNIIIRNEKAFPIEDNKISINQTVFTLQDVYAGRVFPLNSICLRRSAWNDFLEASDIKTNGDIKLSYVVAKAGYIYHFDDYFSVYRKTGKGLSSQWDYKVQFVHDINEWYDFFRQIGFPDKTRHALFQAELINNYIYKHGLNKFPFNEIKKCLFKQKWFIYFRVSASVFVKRAFNKIMKSTNKVFYHAR